jgi:hypothetical protein
MFKCDIPVHCKKSQIEGEWMFKATKAVKKNKEELYDLKCGHKLPSHESTSYKYGMNLDDFTDNFSVNLLNNREAVYTKGNQSKVKL